MKVIKGRPKLWGENKKWGQNVIKKKLNYKYPISSPS